MTLSTSTSTETTEPLSQPPPRRAGTGLFRAFWRWHFYAGFLVVPILLTLSVTGLIYLFRFQIEPLLHADLMQVGQPAGGGARLPYGEQLAAVQEAYPDASVDMLIEGREADLSTDFSVTLADGSVRDVYVDPWTGKVLGSLDPESTLSGLALNVHGTLLAGVPGDRVVELAACWAVVMTLTGYYLFVAGRRARLRRVASRARGAVLRNRHALVGAVAGGWLLMLLVSGLPWTGFWGEKVQTLATEHGSSLWSLDPGAESGTGGKLDESMPDGHVHDLPWAQGDTDVPRSETTVGVGVTLDAAVAVAAQEGLRHPMMVVLPADEAGVYSVIGDAFHDPSRERTVHVDRYTGEVRASYGFEDYPLVAKVVSQGVGLHEGRSLGLLSFWAAALFCLAIVVLCVTGPVMWWRRRPTGGGSVGAPRGRLPLRSTPWLALVVVGLGIFLPLFGLSLIVVLLLDQLLLRRVPRFRVWFDVT